MQGIDELLADIDVFAGLGDEALDLIAGCALNRVFADGERLLTENEQANVFFAIRHGTVALETYVPGRGGMTIETLHGGDVLGWSWLFPPYRNMFDARALGVVRAIAFDGACLRGKCDQDPQLGYVLMQRFAAVMVERLQATRLRLLDVYGHVPAR
jgi:CRP/FNR family transcriptional regulator, cyclic AMP receptor protein